MGKTYQIIAFDLIRHIRAKQYRRAVSYDTIGKETLVVD